jgi:hypothetical protein
MDAEWTKVSKIECLGEVDDYVYDISIENQDPFFFANDILVHNTDSCYFSAYPTLKQDIDSRKIEWNKDVAIQLYDQIAENTNASFPQFMERAFHCPRKNGAIIKAGRELVADRGIFMTKKRYAVNIYDKEGKRLDVNGKRGKIKAMGLDLKRADTPKYIQNFLFDILEDVLAGVSRVEIVEKIKAFKINLEQQPAWTKGSPKGVNKLTWYGEQQEKADKKINMPGHVRASLNWNYLRTLNNDTYSQKIVDGMKIVVCKLKDNLLGMTSIAYPTDELRLPSWFLELPFDDRGMVQTLIDEKIENLLGVLKWNISKDINTSSTFNSLFTFS